MKTFVIVNHYCKDGQSKFYHQGTFACDKIDKAVEYFKNKRFFVTGTYRLFYVEEKELENGVVIDIMPSVLDINQCLMTRVCKWDSNGNFTNDLYLELDKADYTHDELVHVFTANLPRSADTSPALDTTINDGGIF